MSTSPPQTPPAAPPSGAPAPPADVGAPPPAPTGRRAALALRPPSLPAILGWLALVPVLVLSTVLGTHRLAQNGYANVFYSAADRSMLDSLRNFLFAASDPGGLITVDKPPLALWVQTASAKVFGFSPLALLLPEALIGVLTVAVLYAATRRPFGRPAALVAALALAVYPSFVAVSRENGVDAVLILLMVLACGAALRAIRRGSLLALLGSAMCVGLAFNTKTLAAYLVVPGIALAYLLCAPAELWRRLLHLVAAGVVLAAVSFAWIAYVEATPAAQRPYVGGSTDNTEINLTFGYNGFGRVDGQTGGPNQIFVKLGAVAPFPQRTRTLLRAQRTAAPKHVPNPLLPDGHYTSPTPFGGPVGPLRLFHSGLGGQSAWLLPFALLGLVALVLSVVWPPRGTRERTASDAGAEGAEDEPDGGAAPPEGQSARGRATAWWRRVRRDERTAGLIVFGVWFLVEAVVLSFGQGIIHPYYVSALGPGAAAMVGAGAVAFAGFARGRDWRVLLLAIAVAGTVAAQLVLLRREHFLHWLPTVLVVGGAACVLAPLAVRRLAVPAMAVLLAVLLVGPTAFATTTWSVPVEGTFPAAGPRVAGGLGPYGIAPHNVKVARDLMRYIDARRPTHRWEVLTVSSNTAASLTLLGYRAGSVGGYSGTDPALDGPDLARLVARREARYVVLGGAYSSRGGNRATQAVVRACREVPNVTWLHFRRWSIYSLVLYDCAGDERGLRAAG